MSLGIVAAQDFPYIAIQFPQELTPRLSARWLASYWVMPFEAQPQWMSLGPFAWHASDIWSNGRTAHFFLRESWHCLLPLLPKANGWKGNLQLLQEVLQQLGEIWTGHGCIWKQRIFSILISECSHLGMTLVSPERFPLFYSPERNAPFIQRYESRTFLSLFILWVFLSYLSLLIFFFPFFPIFFNSWSR